MCVCVVGCEGCVCVCVQEENARGGKRHQAATPDGIL